MIHKELCCGEGFFTVFTFKGSHVSNNTIMTETCNLCDRENLVLKSEYKSSRPCEYLFRYCDKFCGKTPTRMNTKWKRKEDGDWTRISVEHLCWDHDYCAGQSSDYT